MDTIKGWMNFNSKQRDVEQYTATNNMHPFRENKHLSGEPKPSQNPALQHLLKNP